MDDLKKLAETLGAFQTEEWCVDSILDVEILTPDVIDPCTGLHMLRNKLRAYGYNVTALDIHNWTPDDPPDLIINFLHWFQNLQGKTVFANPPFKYACEFVDHARMLGARKTLIYQKYSWREGSYDSGLHRGEWWEKNPPCRIWVCGDRAHRLRFDLVNNPPKHGDKTAYAWFVWEQGHRGAELTRAIYKRHRYSV